MRRTLLLGAAAAVALTVPGFATAADYVSVTGLSYSKSRLYLDATYTYRCELPAPQYPPFATTTSSGRIDVQQLQGTRNKPVWVYGTGRYTPVCDGVEHTGTTPIYAGQDSPTGAATWQRGYADVTGGELYVYAFDQIGFYYDVLLPIPRTTLMVR